MKVTCYACGAIHDIAPPPWVVDAGRPFRMTCASCGENQEVFPTGLQVLDMEVVGDVTSQEPVFAEADPDVLEEDQAEEAEDFGDEADTVGGDEGEAPPAFEMPRPSAAPEIASMSLPDPDPAAARSAEASEADPRPPLADATPYEAVPDLGATLDAYDDHLPPSDPFGTGADRGYKGVFAADDEPSIPTTDGQFVLQQDGELFNVPDLATLQRWIMEHRIGPDDRLSEWRGPWQRAADRPDLLLFFDAVTRLAGQSVTTVPGRSMGSTPPRTSATHGHADDRTLESELLGDDRPPTLGGPTAPGEPSRRRRRAREVGGTSGLEASPTLVRAEEDLEDEDTEETGPAPLADRRFEPSSAWFPEEPTVPSDTLDEASVPLPLLAHTRPQTPPPIPVMPRDPDHKDVSRRSTGLLPLAAVLVLLFVVAFMMLVPGPDGLLARLAAADARPPRVEVAERDAPSEDAELIRDAAAATLAMGEDAVAEAPSEVQAPSPIPTAPLVESTPVPIAEPVAAPEPEPATTAPEPAQPAEAPKPAPAAPPPPAPKPKPAPVAQAPQPRPAPPSQPAPAPPPEPTPVVRPPGGGYGPLVAAGWLALDGGDVVGAMSLFEEALSLQPSGLEANYGFGYALLRKGRLTQGRQYLCLALSKATRSDRIEISGILVANGLTCE